MRITTVGARLLIIILDIKIKSRLKVTIEAIGAKNSKTANKESPPTTENNDNGKIRSAAACY
jgi:hypothetical protein